MNASVWTSLLDDAGAWGPWLSALGLILFAAQRAWVAYLKHRSADYVRAQAELLRAANEPKIKSLELAALSLAAPSLAAEPPRAMVSPEGGSETTVAADNVKPPPPKSAKPAANPSKAISQDHMNSDWWDLSPTVASYSLREICVPS